MISSIGVDIVRVDRFEAWINYSEERLLKVFNMHEVEDFMHAGDFQYKKQFLAGRFAAKEAFYKALCSLLSKLNFDLETFTFDKVRKHVFVIKNSYEIPELSVDWLSIDEVLGASVPKVDLSISISHEKDFAISTVLIIKSEF
jgi:phosphopantetheine--protein transferase-like protein